VVQLSTALVAKGEFLTPTFDTGINSRFGALDLFARLPKGTSVTAAVRTGQTAKPDASWSEWSKELAAPGGARPSVPNGRYGQVRLTLKANGDVAPEVYRVRWAYLRQNLPPFVREIVALKKGLALLPVPNDEPKSKTVSLGEKSSDDMRRGDDDKHDNRGGRARQIERRGALTLRWVAEDPNGDDLVFDLSYRPVGQTAWLLMQEKLDDPFYTLAAAQLPDGHYEFRVRASDSPANPDGFELEDTRTSRAVVVDNTPPKVDAMEVKVAGKLATVRVVVADSVGPLTDAEMSLDGKPFRPIMPDDGVLDGPGESFSIRLADLTLGSHLLTVRVRDEVDNEGVGDASFVVR